MVGGGDDLSAASLKMPKLLKPEEPDFSASLGDDDDDDGDGGEK